MNGLIVKKKLFNCLSNIFFLNFWIVLIVSFIVMLFVKKINKSTALFSFFSLRRTSDILYLCINIYKVKFSFYIHCGRNLFIVTHMNIYHHIFEFVLFIFRSQIILRIINSISNNCYLMVPLSVVQIHRIERKKNK